MFSQIEGGNFELQGADQKTLSTEYLFGNHLNETFVKILHFSCAITFTSRNSLLRYMLADAHFRDE